MGEIRSGLQSTRRVPQLLLTCDRDVRILGLRKSNCLFDSVSGDCAECLRRDGQSSDQYADGRKLRTHLVYLLARVSL